MIPTSTSAQSDPNPFASDKWTAESITWIQGWTPNLFSFRLTRPRSFRFAPGQWARLGVVKTDLDGTRRLVWRAYSIASAHWDDVLEFYSIVVPGGEFTSELSRLQVGDTVYIEKLPYGFLTTDRFESGSDLWMLATGTGLAPFLSILWDPYVWERFDRLILVHSVREPAELTYREHIQQWQQPGGLTALLDPDAHPTDGAAALAASKLTYVPVVTRVKADTWLSERITLLLRNNTLEQAANCPLDVGHSRIMICGNPEMVEDTRKVLGERGFLPVRRARPGQIAVENYW